jgi:hypothetical protein
MYNNHVHQYHTMCHKISLMECINHMPTCASPNMPTMCIYQYASKCHNHVSQTNTYCCDNQVIPMVYYHQAYAIYECTKHAYQHVSPPVPSKYINHAPIPQHDEFSYIYAKSSIKYVSIKLLVGASTNVPIMHQL